MKPIIKIQNLGKRYNIGVTGYSSYRTLRETISGVFSAPLRRRNGKNENEQLWALENLNLEILPGEVLGVIGRNGAGKSTLLKILTRITEPTVGRVELYGRVGSLLEVGTGFHPELTGRENIFLNGAILGMSRVEIQRRFDEIVSFSEVERFLEMPVKRYSSGMYMRLAFAVAAHMESEILLVDEVLAVGDNEFQKKCVGKMRDVSAGGRTVVFVSHSMGVIANLCSRAVWIDHGHVRSEGDTRDVVADYVSSGMSGDGEVTWREDEDAPSGGGVRLRSVRLFGNRGVSSDILINEPVTIEIEYLNEEVDNQIVCGIELKDKVNSYVFATNNRTSANAAVDEWYGKPRPVGIYKTRCVIPPDLLNADFYSVDLRMVNQRNELKFAVPSVISLRVHETGDMTVEFSGHWPGAVRPRLAWTTDYLDRQ